MYKWLVKLHNCPWGQPYEDKDDAKIMALALNQGRQTPIATVHSVWIEHVMECPVGRFRSQAA